MSDRGAPRSRRGPTFIRPPANAALGDLPQEDLIRLCLGHKEGAWEEFLRRYASLIYSTIHKVVLPESEQEEAFQNTVVAVYRQLPRLRQPEKLVSWIVGIAWRQSINCIRARRKEARVEEVTDQTLRHSLAPPPDRPLPGEEQERLVRAQYARQALETVSERCRRLLAYAFFEDPPLDYAEIARREGMPIGSIGPTRARCLERMRRFFEERGWAG